MPFLFLSNAETTKYAETTKFLSQLHGLEIIAGLDGSLQVGRRESLLAPLYRQRSPHIIIGGAPLLRRGVKDALSAAAFHVGCAQRVQTRTENGRERERDSLWTLLECTPSQKRLGAIGQFSI